MIQKWNRKMPYLGTHLVFVTLICLILAFYNYLMNANSNVSQTMTEVKKLDVKNGLLVRLGQIISSAETNQRGYLLTGHMSYLEHYKSAKKEYLINLDRL